MQAHWIDPSMHSASMPLTILVLRHTARGSSSWTGQVVDTHDRHPSHDQPRRDTHRPSQPNIPRTYPTRLQRSATPTKPALQSGSNASQSVLYTTVTAFSTPPIPRILSNYTCTAIQLIYLFLPTTGKKIHTYLYMMINRSTSTLAFR